MLFWMCGEIRHDNINDNTIDNIGVTSIVKKDSEK